MIVKIFCTNSRYISPKQNLCLHFASFCFLFLTSSIFLSCNNPFQPEIEYTPRLTVYSVLFANEQTVYVRVTSVTRSPLDVSQPVHGASVTLNGQGQSIALVDTAAVIDGDTASCYYAPATIVPGANYTISVEREGYLSATASVTVPLTYSTMPNQGTYAALLNPKDLKTEINFNVNLSGLAKAAFVQMFVECRGLDDSGNLHVSLFNVLPVDSLNPFSEVESDKLLLNIDTTLYQGAFNLAKKYAATMEVSHMYADIVVTQIDDNLYRFFMTSNRTLNPLVMRTDKIVFSNIMRNSGTGIVAGAAVDTTRIFLF
jgi:hypothetical protein